MGLLDWLTGGEDRRGGTDAQDPGEGDPGAPTTIAVDSVLSTGQPAIVTGRVERGTVRPGDRLAAPGSDIGGRVATVEQHHQAVEAAGPGEPVGMELEGVGSRQLRGVDRLREP